MLLRSNVPWRTVTHCWWKIFSLKKPPLLHCLKECIKIADVVRSFMISLSEGLMALKAVFFAPILSSNSMIVDPPSWIWWQSYSRDGVSAVCITISEVQRHRFSVNVWDEPDVLNPPNSLNLFTFFVLYFKTLLHDQRIIKAIKENGNLELICVVTRLSQAIWCNLHLIETVT